MPWDKEHPLIYLQEAMSYRISDMDVASNPRYYGYMDKGGWWMIVQEDTGPPYTYRYIRGQGDYTSNWNNRDSLTYLYYSEAF